MNKRIGFDLDDTLRHDQVFYSSARVEFLDFVYERMEDRAPVDPGIINEVFHEKDSELYEQWREDENRYALSKERIPTAYQRTFRELGERFDYPVGEKELEEAYGIGESIFKSPDEYREQGLVAGAEDVLEFLQEEGDELVLVTAGDTEVQLNKIYGLGLDEWFDSIHIVDEKTPETLQGIFEGAEDSCWMVGNSLTSDIQTALEVGIGAVYLPQENQLGEREEEEVPDEVTVINELRDLTEKYYELESGA